MIVELFIFLIFCQKFIIESVIDARRERKVPRFHENHQPWISVNIKTSRLVLIGFGIAGIIVMSA